MGTAARTAFRCVTQAGVLATLALLHAQALADACVDVTSAAAVPVEEFKLCEHSVDDKAETYACREYRDTDSRYVLLFKGGPRPKAILKQEISGGVAEPRAVRRSTTPPSTAAPPSRSS